MTTFEFGRFRLDADARVLFRDDARIALTPKAVDVLLTLVEHRGAAVGRQELFSKVWADASVEEGTLSSHISLLRKTLGGAYIETIPKRGYRFAGVVERRETAARTLLAVLPFENLSGNRRYDAFSDGLTEEIITQLGRLNPERLGVIARTSSMTYKSTDKTIEQIGRELGVAHVLEGSARRAGSRVRISAQLIQVSDQTHVWADSYEGDLADILALQSRVSAAVAKQIQSRLLPVKEPPQVMPAAYEAYLKGRYSWHRRTKDDLWASVRCFEDAIAIDVGYAAAHAGLADAWLSLMDYGYVAPDEALSKARASIARAVDLDETLDEAHVASGHAALHSFDWRTARREFERALQLNANSANARYYYSNYLTAMTRTEEAIAEAKEAHRLDPLSPAVESNVCAILWQAGRYEETVEWAKRTLTVHPKFARAHEDLGRAYEQMGRYDDAIAELKEAVALTDGAADTLTSLVYTYAVAGRRKEAETVRRRVRSIAKTRFVSSYDFALIALGLGDIDGAFVWMEKAIDERSSAMPFLRTNPRLAAIRADRRFTGLLKRAGLT